MDFIGKYRIIKELVAGEEVKVYIAQQPEQNKQVILKVFRRNSPSQLEVAKFLNEFEVTHPLNIKGVRRAISKELIGDTYLLALEYFDGISLKKYLHEKGPFPIEKFLLVAIPIAESLGRIHESHIIHKDINPFNILFNPLLLETCIIDFEISTVLTRESTPFYNPDLLEGTVQYISPEQTGRMNRSVDYRTDFYSLGITFFEMLTGTVPFQSDDSMELIHFHIAKIPSRVSEINPAVPEMISRIVAKLLSKNAEDRYKSDLGLKADLERCLTELRSKNSIELFVLGLKDQSAKLQIPEKLYGREKPIAQLMQRFERVSARQKAMVVVSGYSGIGKTSLIHEVHKPIAARKGFFISGKSEKFQRSTPYFAILSAFRDLLRQIESRHDKILVWKEKLQRALGTNAQLIIDVLPELENVMGKQQAVDPLPPAERQNRFNLLFRNFMGVFADEEHPLVIFLDDVQWSDAASMNLLEDIISNPGLEYLLIILAYRDNEVTPTHPVRLTLDKIEKQSPEKITNILLPPLQAKDVIHLVSDTLLNDEDESAPLGTLIHLKTDGNPFFINQVLYRLYEDHLLKFDAGEKKWTWDLEAIIDHNISSNVVDLLIYKIRKLSPATINVLKYAACIGSKFDLATLSMINKKSHSQTLDALWEAIAEGLVVPLNNSYKIVRLENSEVENPVFKFSHDRVQQSCTELLSEEEISQIRYSIGEFLYSHGTAEELEERIFEITNHLNIGRSMLQSEEKMIELATLNLRCGKKAMASSAYDAASNYFQTGVELLPESSWKKNYDLTHQLHLNLAESEYLNARTHEADILMNEVFNHSKTNIEKSEVYSKKLNLYANLVRYGEAEQQGYKGLALFGISIPRKKSALQFGILKELLKAKFLLRNKEPEDILRLPLLPDEKSNAVVRLMADFSSVSYYSNPELFIYLNLKVANYSTSKGLTEYSPLAYAYYAMILGIVLGQFREGFRFGKAALQLSEQMRNEANTGKVSLVLWAAIAQWSQPLRNTIPELMKAYQQCLEHGDFWFGGTSVNAATAAQLAAGNALEDVYYEFVKYKPFLKKNNAQTDLCYNLIFSMEELLAIPRERSVLSQEEFEEQNFLALNLERNHLYYLSFYYTYKMQYCYLTENYTEGCEYAFKVRSIIDKGAKGSVIEFECCVYQSLLFIARYKQATPGEQARYKKYLQKNLTKLKKWMKSSKENFEHKYWLIAGAWKYIQDSVANTDNDSKSADTNTARAFEWLSLSAQRAHEEGFYQYEAIAYEWLAMICIEAKNQKLAMFYINECFANYEEWGAKVKMQLLENKFGEWLRDRDMDFEQKTMYSIKSKSQGSTTGVMELDHFSVVKASQALSGEIVLEKLLDKMMNIMIENAGAQMGYLLLKEDDVWMIKAKGALESESLNEFIPQPMIGSDLVPETIISSVIREKQSIVLADAASDKSFFNDPYILQTKPKSVLATPIIQQGKLICVLYLENNLVTGAFTDDRIDVLQLLSSQAAISIDNARLYTDLREEITERQKAQEEVKRSEEQLKQYLEGVPVGVFVIDGKGHPFYANKMAKELMGSGIVPNAAMDQLATVYHTTKSGTNKEYPATEFPIIKALKGITSTVDDMEIHKGNTIVPLEVSATPIYDEHGKIIFAIAAFQDVTQRLAAKKALEEYSQTLETKVKERTTEIEEKNTELRHAMIELKETQSQLIQSEKMASLGQLTAGVAHEINNPINFVSGSVQPLRRNIDELIMVFDRYATLKPNGDITQKINEIDKLKKDLDVDYTRQEIFSLLKGIEEGSNRTAEIVKGLRNFSRLDESILKKVNVQEGINSTLILLNNKILQHGIRIEKNYGDAPPIDCYPGQLNQVWMNILTNAIQAIGGPGTINITTRAAGDHLTVTIQDSGKGMSEEIRKKIFDPFYTTKEIGEGTGLGLSISYGIIEKHKGKIEVFSEPGKGATFKITLPLVLT